MTERGKKAGKGERQESQRQDIRLITTYCETGKNAAIHLKELHGEDDQRLAPFMDALLDLGVYVLPTTERFDNDMEMAEKNAMGRPFGIDLDTLSPNIQLILYPKMIYLPTEEEITEAKEEGFEMRIEGPQAMIYVLDGFENETRNVENMAANLYFMGHMTNSLLQGRISFEEGERSKEFREEIKQALGLVRQYTQKLPQERREKLSSRIARILDLEDTGLEREAHNYTLYHTEPIKMRGLYEPKRKDAPSLKPEQAVKNKRLFLHLDERDLQERIKKDNANGLPSLPWKEYGKNRWNRDNQLFGRYKAPITDGALRIDFLLDSTYMPLRYGFFHTIEMTRIEDRQIKEHVILGQEFSSPVIIAGDFDFSNPETEELLKKLVEDKGVKIEVGRVIDDVLRLSTEKNLKRLH